MFDTLPVLRHLVQNQLLHRKRRNEKHGDRIQIAQQRADRGDTSEFGASGDAPRTPSTGDLVLLWTVSNFSGKPGM